MIKSFGSKETEKIYNGKRSSKLPGDIQNPARRKLKMLNNAIEIQDLRNPPGNHFEALDGMKGIYSIRINIQWRIIFRWNDGAEDAEIVDYH